MLKGREFTVNDDVNYIYKIKGDHIYFKHISTGMDWAQHNFDIKLLNGVWSLISINETLSDKIFTIPECRNGVIKLNVIPSHDVQDFINHLKNKKNYKLLGTDLAHYDMFIEQIDKHAGEKFK